MEISIDFAGRGHAAFGRRPEAAAYLLDFLTGQITSAFSSQHSVLIIHGVSPFIIGGPLNGPGSSKRSLPGKNGYWSGLPHSLWKVSPSRVPAAASVHAVNVLSPPATIATSCSFKSRAPLRTNTLF